MGSFIGKGQFLAGWGMGQRDVEYACLSAGHNSKSAQPNFTKFLCTLPVAVTRSSSNGVAICYILPVLRVGPVGRLKPDVMFRRVRQVAVPVGRRSTTAFG